MMQSDDCSSTESEQSFTLTCVRPPDKSSDYKHVVVELWKSTEGMLEQMKCSLCKQLVPAPVQWACTEGHPICSECSATVPFCAWEPRGSRDVRNMCRCILAPARLTLHDLIYNRSTFQCPFKAYGCQDQPEGSILQHHFRTCPYSPIRTNNYNGNA